MSSTPSPKISVIVPVFNAEDSLPACLLSLAEQTYPDYEVIVVDDGSTDGSASVARDCRCSVVRLTGNQGAAAARNEGAARAAGEILAFTDADCVVPPGWLTSIAQALRPGVSAVTGVYGKPEGGTLFSRFATHDIRFRFMRLRAGSNVFGTYNAAVRRQVFEEVGGFDSTIEGASWEDVELGLRIAARGHRLLIDKCNQVQHRSTDRLSDYLRKQVRKAGGQMEMRGSRVSSDYIDGWVCLQVALTSLLPPAMLAGLWSAAWGAAALGASLAGIWLSNGVLLKALWADGGVSLAGAGCAWLPLRNLAWAAGILRSLGRVLGFSLALDNRFWRKAWKR